MKSANQKRFVIDIDANLANIRLMLSLINIKNAVNILLKINNMTNEIQNLEEQIKFHEERIDFMRKTARKKIDKEYEEIKILKNRIKNLCQE